ncbi:MAG: hypothetical protein B6242_08300 [Anaerolineaceae bacterium 4572_78]|nr:MAG: hypothetical protein B6242_08300 [Anaerolineaceae bacterium 4572_78]
MLLFNVTPHRRIVHLCLAGMEIAWFTPFLLFIYHSAQDLGVITIFAILLTILLMWMMAFEVINSLSDYDPRYGFLLLGLIAGSTLLIIASWLFGAMIENGLSGAWQAVANIFNTDKSLPTQVWLVFLNLYICQRAVSANTRDFGFFGIAFNFRVGLLLMIFGGILFSYTTEQNVTALLWIYMVLGLTAISVTRLDEKAVGMHSSGKLLPHHRMGQLFFSVVITLAFAAILSLILSPEILWHFLVWLTPVWTFFLKIFVMILAGLIWLFEPVLVLIGQLLQFIAENFDWEGLQEVTDNLMQPPTEENGTGEGHHPPKYGPVPWWVFSGLRCMGLSVIVLIFIGFILLFLERIYPYLRGEDEDEEPESEDMTFGGSIYGRGLQWLKGMAGLVNKYGLSRQLLAAISVENIYANVCRLAKQRSYPRPLAQPPDDYLPTLKHAFLEQDDALQRITAMYMQVHYGDTPVSLEEFLQVQTDYHQVRRAEKPL